MFYLGTGLIVLAIACSISASLCYGNVIAGRTRWLRWGRASTFAALLFAATSALLLLMLFLLQRYDIRYVYDYSSSELELRFRMAAVWAGQPGSLVVWALVMAGALDASHGLSNACQLSAGLVAATVAHYRTRSRTAASLTRPHP